MTELDIRYATALLELAAESDTIGETLEQAVFLCGTLRDSGMMNILVHPHISGAEKTAALRDAFERRITEHLFGFLCLMVDKNREAYIVSVITELVESIRRLQRITTANIVSAVPLKEPQILKLKELLSKKLDKQVEIQTTVDESIIGGFYIRVDGYLIDHTVKTQLRDMKVHIEKRSAAHDTQA